MIRFAFDEILIMKEFNARVYRMGLSAQTAEFKKNQKNNFEFIIHGTIHDQMKIDWFEFNLCLRLPLYVPLSLTKLANAYILSFTHSISIFEA